MERAVSLGRPSPEVELAWGSRSMSRTRRSAAASDAARLMAVVVLPTPPFWFASAMTLVIVDLLSVSRGTLRAAEHHQEIPIPARNRHHPIEDEPRHRGR